MSQFFGEDYQFGHHSFLESRHPEVTKNLHYVEGSQKKVSAHGLLHMLLNKYIRHVKKMKFFIFIKIVFIHHKTCFQQFLRRQRTTKLAQIITENKNL